MNIPDSELETSHATWEQAGKDADLTLEVATDVPMYFRRIPATGPEGAWVGSRGYQNDEEPRHRVILPEYFLGTFPVTQAQFAVWTGSPAYEEWFANHQEKIKGGEPHLNEFSGDPSRLPAERVSWWEAEAFAKWLGDETGAEVRLPTEAEWEVACRAGSATEYWNGDGEPALDEVGWFANNSDERTHPLGAKGEAHPSRLFDLHGNVSEWCRDYFSTAAYAQRGENSVRPVVDDPSRVEREAIHPWMLSAETMLGRSDDERGVREEDEPGLKALITLFESRSDSQSREVAAALNEVRKQRHWEDAALRWRDPLASWLQGILAPRRGEDEPFRVLRGGSWIYAAGYCRSAFRYWDLPGIRVRRLGFRLLVSPGPTGDGPTESGHACERAEEQRGEATDGTEVGGLCGETFSQKEGGSE